MAGKFKWTGSIRCEWMWLLTSRCKGVVVEVMERFRDDFRALAPITQGIDISESKRYKLVFPRVNGEQFPVFVRIDPDSGQPIYSEE